ncbi:hypothetical protein U2F26_35020 [Micromonospora sp. 4G57]|uniref:Uncharacterized protein n=1 Tax=Micromonospora sicca TaxID=2202420 RepID=A0ABU5JPM9_9ACTN|nr:MULTISPECIES: hypothetical protein [unclassified Micromonospora]MDZ5447851.1 hypothetical protein [Micromonospora sp. 4G57]MDZ5494585.1 hypothetical protein [Micromonospora sp. 4G53]
MKFAGTVVFTYVVGVFASFLPYHWRAGLDKNWREFVLGNITWFLMLFGKQIAWPAVFIYWAIKGFPKSPWVAIYNYKGHEVRRMMRRDQAITEGVLTA